MGARVTNGFTIIETTLFLAVSGLLVLLILVGTGTSISNQRYGDAVQSFKNLLQKQYSSLSSVQNDRSNSLLCNSDVQITEPEVPTAGSPVIGQSDCFIIGKYTRIDAAGNIAIYTVLARGIDSYAGVAPVDSIDALRKKYKLNISKDQVEKTEMQWGTHLAWATPVGADESNPSATLSLLFVRSPDDGRVYTFSNSIIPADEDDITQAFLKEKLLITASTLPGQGKRTLCVDAAGWNISGATAVTIAGYAASPSAIAVQSNPDAEQLGVPERC